MSCRDASRSEKATQGVRRLVGTPEDHAHLHKTHAPRALRVLRPPLTPATPDECNAPRDGCVKVARYAPTKTSSIPGA